MDPRLGWLEGRIRDFVRGERNLLEQIAASPAVSQFLNDQNTTKLLAIVLKDGSVSDEFFGI